MKTRHQPSPRTATRHLVAQEEIAAYRSEGEEYPFTVRPLAIGEGGGYLIEFPDLPGCISDGETVGQAIANGMDAKRDWLAVAREQGRSIPEAGGQSSGKWVQRVPRSLHTRLVERAEREGVSLNTLVVSLIAEGLGKPSKPGAQMEVAKSVMRENRVALRKLAK